MSSFRRRAPTPLPLVISIISFISHATSGLQNLIASSSPKIGRVQAGPITISALGCGTWSWGNRLLWDYDPSQDEQIYQAYRLTRQAGVTVFDTADSYGTFDLNGRAEVLLGDFERRYQDELSTTGSTWWKPLSNSYNPQQQQQVATKFAPYPWRITSESFVTAAQESLNRLQQDRLAIAQLHWSTANYQPLQERALWKGLADIYDRGLTQAVGVSNYGPIQLAKIADYLKARQVPLATAQIQYSLMTYQTAQYMNQACNDPAIQCRLISYSPLCLGLLTGKYSLDKLPRPGNPRRQLFRELLPGAQPLLNTLKVVAKDYNKTPAQIAINWALCKDTVPIPGCRTLEQAKGNLDAANFRLKRDAIAELDNAALKVSKPMIQNIFKPNNILIISGRDPSTAGILHNKKVPIFWHGKFQHTAIQYAYPNECTCHKGNVAASNKP